MIGALLLQKQTSSFNLKLGGRRRDGSENDVHIFFSVSVRVFLFRHNFHHLVILHLSLLV